MSEFLYILFYLAVLALVGGCVAALFIMPDKSKAVPTNRRTPIQPSPQAAREAQRIRGAYRLSSLEDLLAQVASLGAWGMILEAQVFPDIKLHVQMVVGPNEVELCAPSIDPRDEYEFRQLAEKTSLEYRFVEGRYCVDLAGTWPQIAARARRVIESLYGARADKEIYFRVHSPPCGPSLK